jgi:hypothetical protein
LTLTAAVAVGLGLALATCAAVEDAGTARAAAPAAASQSVAATTASSVSYRRWIAVWNRTDEALTAYPLEITSQAGTGGLDHAGLVAAGKAQADGSDVRVLVDGVEVDRWMAYTGTDHTKVWINLGLPEPVTASLVLAYTSGENLTTLTLGDTAGFPANGTVYNTASGEAFTYQGKDATHLVGIDRSVNGTSPAVGNGGDTFVLVEHDVALLYGGSAARAPDAHYAPAFEVVTSTNAVWLYREFGEDDGLRTGAWTTSLALSVFYGGDHGAAANPWVEIGLRMDGAAPSPDNFVFLSNPCGIAQVTMIGEKYADDAMAQVAWSMGSGNRLASSTDGTTWITEHKIPAPASTATWEPWSRDESLVAGSAYVALVQHEAAMWTNLESSDAVVALDSAHTPGVSLAGEQLAALLLETATTPSRVAGGGQLAYSLRVTNSGQIDLHANLTSTLSSHVTPSGTLAWTPVITPGGVWSTAFTVTVAPDYIGPLDNVVRVTTDEGATAEYTATVTVYHHIYLPLVARDYTTFHHVDDAPGNCAAGLPIQFAPHEYRENLDHANDNDWWAFEAISGTTYVVQTYDLESRADTVLALWSADCSSKLAENDDRETGDPASGSLIQWVATESGTLRVLSHGFNWPVYGVDTAYTLKVSTGALSAPPPLADVRAKATPPATPVPGGRR